MYSNMLYADFGISPWGNEINLSFGIHPNSIKNDVLQWYKEINILSGYDKQIRS